MFCTETGLSVGCISRGDTAGSESTAGLYGLLIDGIKSPSVGRTCTSLY